MSFSRHAYNAYGNPYYTGITIPWPGYPGNVDTPPSFLDLTVADLDAYFATSLNGAAWAALTPEVKEHALVEAQRWLATLCWHKEECCGRDFDKAVLMATAELALALATHPTAIIGEPSDNRWVKRERLDVLDIHYEHLDNTKRYSGVAGNGRDPLLLQRFPWLSDILSCWLDAGKREIRLFRN